MLDRNYEEMYNNWKEYFKPEKITDRIVIKPSWENYEKVLTKAGASVDDMEDKALILVEVILDADNRKNHSLKS